MPLPRYYTGRMSTVETYQITCTSLDDTLAFAANLGSKLRGGEVIELVGDLGSGKTVFVKGLAQGMGSADVVSSPSFTLSNEYQAGNLRLLHFDFYRLDEPGILRDELAEVVGDDQTVVAIEWADVVADVLPAEHVAIRIQVHGENERVLDCEYPETMSYLFPNT